MERFLPLILIIIFANCGERRDRPNDAVAMAFKPDTSINKILKLRDASSTPDSIKAAIKNGRVVLSTKDETKFLVAYQYPGDSLGSFMRFELKGMTSELADSPYIKTQLEKFETETGLTFISNLTELLKKKGSNYTISQNSDVFVYQYFDVPEDFLKRYKSEEYLFEIQSINNYVTSIEFGFVPTAEPYTDQPPPPSTNIDRLMKVEKDDTLKFQH